jgi:hypothetical protein
MYTKHYFQKPDFIRSPTYDLILCDSRAGAGKCGNVVFVGISRQICRLKYLPISRGQHK